MGVGFLWQPAPILKLPKDPLRVTSFVVTGMMENDLLWITKYMPIPSIIQEIPRTSGQGQNPNILLLLIFYYSLFSTISHSSHIVACWIHQEYLLPGTQLMPLLFFFFLPRGSYGRFPHFPLVFAQSSTSQEAIPAIQTPYPPHSAVFVFVTLSTAWHC